MSEYYLFMRVYPNIITIIRGIAEYTREPSEARNNVTSEYEGYRVI